MDPVPAMATASAAVNTIKKGFAVGRDIEQMASDLGRWMGALSDIEAKSGDDFLSKCYTWLKDQSDFSGASDA